MRLTNKLDLPESIVRAVANDGYSRGDADISVTQLIAPPRQVALMEQHADEIEEDVSDRIWSLMGQVVHGILERSASPDALTEERLFMRVRGWTISGALDHVTMPDRTCIDDYKTCSSWSVIFGPKVEWICQLNVYAELLSRYGFDDIAHLNVIAILRDWQKNKAKFDPSYPQQQVVRVPLPVWSPADRLAYIEERVRLHQAARERLPECSADDRWNRGSKWAVMSSARKRALAVFDHPTFAEKRRQMETERAIAKASMAPKGTAAAKVPRIYVEERPGEDVRCESYCAVAPFCDQWARLRGQKGQAA